MSFDGKRNSKTQNSVVVLPGRTDNPDPAQTGQVKLKDPTSHGNDVKVEDLPWVTCAHPPLLSSFAGRPPPRGTSGEIDSDGPPGHRKLKFIYTELTNQENSMAGNSNLFTFNKDILKNFKHAENYFPLPDIKETQKRGALVREIKEKSKAFSTDLLKGLPINSSLFAMIEQKLPEKKDIETAKEHFNNILDSSVLSQLPGKAMSLGSMFSGMSKSNKKKITKALPKDLLPAFESLAYILPSIEESGYLSDSRVNEEVFLKNAIELLSQCKTVSDLNEVLLRLTSDETLFGLDQLKDIKIVVNTPFGNLIQIISATGEIRLANSNTNNATTESSSTFDSFMNSSSASGGAPSINPGENLFGDSASTMFDMFKRTAPESLQSAVDLLKNTNSTQQATKRNDIMRVFSEGGSLIDRFMKNIG